MIKINLLPTEGTRKVKKKTGDQTQFIVAGASVVLTVLFCTYFLWYVPNAKISQLKAEETQAKQELARLQEQVKVVEDFEKNKKVLQKKMGIIKKLRDKQGGPVHVLDDLSRLLPDRVWLASIVEKGGNLDVNGNALSNSDIVDYIGNLKKSPYFQEVKLEESRKKTEKDVPVYNFKLNIKTTL